jgi:hypothetical protein
MSEMLETLDPAALELLGRADVPEPPPGLEERMLARLQSALAPVAVAAAVAHAPAAAAPAAAGALGKLAIPAILASLVVGAVGGAMIHPAPIVPPPIVINLPAPIIVAAPLPEPLAPPPEVKKPAAVVHHAKPVVEAPKPAAAPAVNPDALLAEERNMLETARSALVRGEPKLAADALERHQQRFPAGRLAEERESLWIQALIRTGQFEQARAHAARFKAEFPRSLLLPAVDASLASIPK